MTKAEQFFYDNAGFGYDPETETQEEGKLRCAAHLAHAEQWARDEGCYFEWAEDPEADREEGVDYPYYACIAHHPDGHTASMCAVDLTADWMRNPYRRVVEAELASELMGE